MAAHSELTVRQIMISEPVRMGPTQTIQEALDRMNQYRVGAILILDDQMRSLGIFTERDLQKKVVTASAGWRNLPVSEWMSPDPYTIGPEADWEEAMMSMQRLRVRHLPVVEDGKVIGIVSFRQMMTRRAEYLNQVVAARTRELKQVNDQLLARDAELTHYMKVAGRLQSRLVLPQSPPTWEELGWAIHFAPLDPLGGDYYDFSHPDDDHLGILIADASGHSIPAALVAILTRFAFEHISTRTTSPGQVLGYMNQRLQDIADERFVTAFFGIFHRPTRMLTYANAGHPHPILYDVSEQKTTCLSVRGFPLGINPEEIYREKEVQLEQEDRLCFFTDGLPDTCDERGESFGTQRLTNYLKQHRDHNAKTLLDGLVEHLNSFRGNQKRSDDLTVLITELR